jgi:hypothetical protein
MNYLNIFFIGSIILIFFLYGAILSKIVDEIFPNHRGDIPDYQMAIETLSEVLFAYLIYVIFSKYYLILIKKMFKIIDQNVPFYMEQILLIAFSSGLYKYLIKSNMKTNYLKEKYITIF